MRQSKESAKLQKQMEDLVTLLRNDCDIEASWDDLRKFWHIGLTENGMLMRDRACKAEAENAKLRELCKETADFVLLCCGECDVSDISSCTHSECDAKKAWIHMQELGIEIES